jgi:hypothetical protein
VFDQIEAEEQQSQCLQCSLAPVANEAETTVEVEQKEQFNTLALPAAATEEAALGESATAEEQEPIPVALPHQDDGADVDIDPVRGLHQWQKLHHVHHRYTQLPLSS